MERERLWERAAAMGTRLHKGLQQALGDHKHVGDIRGGKGLLAAVELVEDRGTKAPFGADKKVGPRVLAEMTKRGVITRARAGAHLLRPAADRQRGAGGPPRLGHPRLDQGRHRYLSEGRPSSSPSPLWGRG